MDAHLFEFPSGRPVAKIPVGGGIARLATKADMVLVFPAKDRGTAVFDVKANKFAGVMKSIAFDIYDKQYVKENPNGELMLAEIDSKNWSSNVHYVQLPTPQLGNIQLLTVSDDLQWLAISQTTRGGIFDLKQGTREHYFRNFNGAWFSSDNKLWADFPKSDQTGRTLATFNVGNDAPLDTRPLEEGLAGRQEGQYFIETQYDRNTVTLQVRDLKTNNVLWSRDMKGDPRLNIDANAKTVVITWRASAPSAKDAAKNDATLATQLSRINERENSYYMEICDLETGKALGHLAVDTGKRSFSVTSVQANANFMSILDDEGRVHLYSISGSQEPSVMFAAEADLSRTGLFAVSSDEHRLQVHDARNMEPIDEYVFESPIASAQFVGDGSYLAVVTRDQTAYILKPKAHDTDAVPAAK